MQTGNNSSSSSSTTSTCTSNYSFQGFLQGWFRRQDQLLADIAAATEAAAQGKTEGAAAAAADDGGGQTTELITRVLGHFEEYYEHKSRVAHHNVFDLFSPTWCSSFECAFFWITGFKPGVLLQLVADSVHDLSSDQTRVLDRLKRETRVEEKRVTEELARIQENIAAPPLMGVLINAGRDGDERYSSTTRESMDWLRSMLEAVVADADSLRATTAAKVVDILSPDQCLRFLAAAIRLQQGMRSLGMQRDYLGQ